MKMYDKGGREGQKNADPMMKKGEGSKPMPADGCGHKKNIPGFSVGGEKAGKC